VRTGAHHPCTSCSALPQIPHDNSLTHPPRALHAAWLCSLQVVYLPSCVTRMMGPSASDSEKDSVHDKLMSLFSKAGYEVRVWSMHCSVTVCVLSV